MALSGRKRLLRLSRGPEQSGRAESIPVSRRTHLATHAPATQPEASPLVGTDAEIGQRLAPKTADTSSLARSALCRQTPKVEAVCPNWARTALCGGRSAMTVPTAIQIENLGR